MSKKLKLDERLAGPTSKDSGGRTRSYVDERYSSNYGRKLLALNAKKDALVFQATHFEVCEEDGEDFVDIFGVYEHGCPVSVSVQAFALISIFWLQMGSRPVTAGPSRTT